MESTVNKRIVAMLKTLNLDELEVAKRIGKHPSTLYRIVNGENVPSRTTVKLIAEAIGVNYDYLMTGKGESLMQINAKKEVNLNPWKDEAYQLLKAEVLDLRAKHSQAMDMVAKMIDRMSLGKHKGYALTAKEHKAFLLHN